MNNYYKKKAFKYKHKYLLLKNISNNDFYNSKNKIIITKKIFNDEQLYNLLGILKKYFEKDVLQKLENFERPLVKSYGDIVERKKGRFELSPNNEVKEKIMNILYQSEKFVKYNKIAKDYIKYATGEDVVEELCLLILEPNTGDGNYHRDIFVKSTNDFTSKTFYITHIIYLDGKASTQFCLQSENNSNDDSNLYDVVKIDSDPGKMILFDGRIIHKGLKNNSSENRYAIYISYYKKSYVDEESILPKLF